MEPEAFITCISNPGGSSSSSSSSSSEPGIYTYAFSSTCQLLSHFKHLDCASASVLRSTHGSLPNSGDYLACLSTQRSMLHFFTWSKEKQTEATRCATPEKLHHLTFIANGAFCIGGAESGKCYAWETASGRLLRVWKAHYRAVSVLARAPGFVASGGKDGMVMVWKVSDVVDEAVQRIEPVHAWTQHSLGITALKWSRSGVGGRIVSASSDATVKLWSVLVGKCVQSFTLPCALNCVALDPFERWVYAGGVDHKVYAKGLNEAVVQREGTSGEVGKNIVLGAHAAAVTAMAVNESGSLLVSGALDGTCRVWDTLSKQVVKSLVFHGTVKSIMSTWAPPTDASAKGRSNEGRTGLLPLKPFLKYKDAPRSQSDRTGWTVVPWLTKDEGAQLEAGMDGHERPPDAMDISQIGAGSSSVGMGMQGNGLEVERLQASLASLEEDNERWREASSRLYAMAVENVTR